MRATVLSAVLIVTVCATVGACNQSTPVDLTARTVNIDLECLDDGGVSFTVTPWRVQFPEHGAIRWVMGKTNVRQAEIRPANPEPAKWPFVAPSFSAKPGTPAEGRNLKPKRPPQPGDVYKYVISTICYRDGGVQDTVIIDPDMIIPPSFQ